MTRDDVIEKLRGERGALRPFAVRRLAVFGSAARDEMKTGSDVDILVEFEPGAHIGLFEFSKLQRHLSEILGAKVDLVTPEALRPEFRDKILQELVDAA